jgi:hypothetical protein
MQKALKKFAHFGLALLWSTRPSGESPQFLRILPFLQVLLLFSGGCSWWLECED